eukprot:g3009.t1
MLLSLMHALAPLSVLLDCVIFALLLQSMLQGTFALALTPITNGNINAAARLWNSNQTLAESIYGHISEWDTSNVTMMSGIFAGTHENYNTFNGDISKWNTLKVSALERTFFFASNFNSDLSKWNTSKVSTLEQTFYSASNFNGDLSKWDTSKVSTLQNSESMDGVDVGHVESVDSALHKWDTSKVETLYNTFYRASNFNGNLSMWDTSKVTTLYQTFSIARNFNGDLSKWDTSKVSTLYRSKSDV